MYKVNPGVFNFRVTKYDLAVNFVFMLKNETSVGLRFNVVLDWLDHLKLVRPARN